MAVMTKFKIALSVAIVAATASTRVAAAKHHPIRHPPAASFDRSVAGRSDYGSTPTFRAGEHYIWVQDQYYND